MVMTILYLNVIVLLKRYVSELLFFLFLFFLSLGLSCLQLLFVLVCYQLRYLAFSCEETVQHMSYSG
jgi:hypothetical protein